MRRRVVFASTALAVLVAAGVAVGAAQAGQDEHATDGVADARSRATTARFTVVEHAISDTVVDLGATGDSPGDLLAFANPVFDKTNSDKVGRDQGSCVRTVVGKAWQCSWTTWLPEGSLVVEGPFYDKRDSVLAITGGTGAYSRARGEMHLHARSATLIAFKFSVQN